MAIIQAGKQFTADTLRQDAGNLASMQRDHAVAGMQLKAQLETWTAEDMLALEPGPGGRPLTQQEIDAIKGFFIGDQPAIYDLIAASTWIKQLLGTGV